MRRVAPTSLDYGRRSPRKLLRAVVARLLGASASPAQALAELPARVDTPLLFPARRGGYLYLEYFRADEWTPAVRAAGLEHRSPYSLRHTFATFAIGAGVSLFELARFMGTSVEQIDKTYGHLLPDTLERARTALDAFLATDTRKAEQAGCTRSEPRASPRRPPAQTIENPRPRGGFSLLEAGQFPPPAP